MEPSLLTYQQIEKPIYNRLWGFYPMRRPKITKPTIQAILLFLLAAALRAGWATVAQWREDQATNLWLGFTRSLNKLPIGLISTQGLPNPNGMPLLAIFLSHLPGLLPVSLLLGAVQAVIVVLIWRMSGAPRAFLPVTLAMLTSVTLCATSVEFFNQWLLTDVNLLFLLWVVTYLRRPVWWMLPLWLGLAACAPALYLAGALNALAIGLLGGFLILRHPPINWRSDWWKALSVTVLLLVLAAVITWMPFFRAVSLSALGSVNSGAGMTPPQKLMAALESILLMPWWVILQWSGPLSTIMYQNDARLLSPLTAGFLNGIGWLQVTAAGLACAWLILVGLIIPAKNRSGRRKPKDYFATFDAHTAWPAAISFAFIAICYILSPLLGGAMWSRGERPDQLVQFLPFFLILWFLAPLAVPLSTPARRMAIRVSLGLAIVYSLLNLSAGALVIRSQLDYRGSILTQADVPLLDKIDAVDFIARDWRTRSSSTRIPVDYDLGGGLWDYLPGFGRKYQPWFPATYTLGREFDYELLRCYSLTNSQEGIQLRSLSQARYLVNYAFEPPPPMAGLSQAYIFGRLRVTVNADPH
jgi:hypothetical protein